MYVNLFSTHNMYFVVKHFHVRKPYYLVKKYFFISVTISRYCHKEPSNFPPCFFFLSSILAILGSLNQKVIIMNVSPFSVWMKLMICNFELVLMMLLLWNVLMLVTTHLYCVAVTCSAPRIPHARANMLYQPWPALPVMTADNKKYSSKRD